MLGVAQDGAQLVVFEDRALQLEQTVEEAQVVLDPVVDFLEQQLLLRKGALQRLLRYDQRLLGAAQLREVGQRVEHVFPSNARRSDPDVSLLARGSQLVQLLDAHGLAGPEALTDALRESRLMAVELIQVCAVEFLQMAVRVLGRRGIVEVQCEPVAALIFPDNSGIRDRLEDRPEEQLPVPQRSLRFHLIGDVVRLDRVPLFAQG